MSASVVADPHDPTRRTLPISSMAQVRTHTAGLMRQHRSALAWVIVLHALAAIAALATPRLVGDLVGELTSHTTLRAINRLCLWLAVAVVLQTILTWFARRAAFRLGETVFAQLRERFIERVVELPLSTVERSGTGDLVARTTNDIDSLSMVVRYGIPSIFVACVTTLLTFVAAMLVNPLLAVSLLVGVPLMSTSTRRYLRYATAGYLRERAAYAVGNGVITETVEGARTVDALGLSRRRRQRIDESVGEMFDAEMYTLGLRLRWFPQVDFAILGPAAIALLWGGFLVTQGHASLAQVTTVVLYAQALGDPFDDLLSWLDEIQVGATSLARIIGVEQVGPDRTATGATPASADLSADDVRYAYRPGHDVLGGVSLQLRQGERLAIVGPSGAGKSTLGRLLAGIDGPTSGTVSVGGVPLVDLTLPDLRGEVALVTQEHHVFVGTLRDNLLLAAPDADDVTLWSALRAVDAEQWARILPDGLDTTVGAGGHGLTDAQSQQLALARLVLADPHTLVLDEATSLLDPRAARHLERSLNAVVAGRTIVAIAHRLHTAHDADRVAIVEAGRISEIGSHDELLAAGGSYAELWRSWRDEPSDASASRSGAARPGGSDQPDRPDRSDSVDAAVSSTDV
ncbi:ABC transporter ATP-binding protein [Rudaeicoccus suwonensis]|uniref:ABC-type multidrug transport system fused ATPase/permease subunit n=1 Tax=Rudaeicoccus suwonensis TaxID=657409 RepID=A0A561E8G2_9MICO|nr:ABC transporter ATP-binding protein [Rudaeicoccus suwonensis]TWE11908.1 ABC-type multidrug transport system fused ATPase/permease subunit [Rudaeicoccus suwonensis]